MAEKGEKIERKDSPFEKLIPILLVASIVLAFMVGVLWQKVGNLEGGKGKTEATVTPPAGNQAQKPTSGKLTKEQAANVQKVTDQDHIRGSKDAEVFLIEYSDYQCPFCARFHPTAQQVVDEYEGKVAWVYRHFPLDQIHPKARPAAEASECVTKLGGDEAWWEFTDVIFEDLEANIDRLAEIAREVGVAIAEYEECRQGGEFADFVEEQYQGGLAAGVAGTPGNIILNKKGEAWLIPGAVPFEQLKTTIDEALGS